MKKTVSLFLCFLFALTSYTQKEKISGVKDLIILSQNSLAHNHNRALLLAKQAFQLAKGGTENEKIEATANLAGIHLMRGEIDNGHTYVSLLHKMAEAYNPEKCLFQYYYQLADIKFNQGFFKDAQIFVDSAFRIARNSTVKEDTATLILLSAMIDASMIKYESAVKKMETACNVPGVSSVTNRLARMQQMIYSGKNFAARLKGLDTMVYNLHKEGNTFMLGQYYSCTGLAYLMNMNFPLAYSRTTEALQFFRKAQSPFNEAMTQVTLGTILHMRNKCDSAILVNKQAVSTLSGLKNYLPLAMAHTQLSACYRILHDTANARKHYLLSQEYNQKIKNPLLAANNMLELAYIKKGKGDKKGADSIANAATLVVQKYSGTTAVAKFAGKKDTVNDETILTHAIELNRNVNFLKDSQASIANAKAILEIETRYRTRQKNDSLALQYQQLKIQQAELKLKETQKKNLLTGLAGLLVLLGIIAFLWRSKVKQNRRLIEEQGKVSALMGILKHETIRQFGNLDHSLSKILHNVEPQKKVAKALVEVKSYNQLYNLLFISPKKTGVSLREVFKKLFEYNCSEMNVDAPPAFNIEGDAFYGFQKADFLVLYMNELISNSLEHAFRNNAAEAPAIAIRISSNESSIVIDYKDNGSGMNTVTADAPLKQGTGLYYIHVLAEQSLTGNLEVYNERGRQYILTIPQKEA